MAGSHLNATVVQMISIHLESLDKQQRLVVLVTTSTTPIRMLKLLNAILIARKERSEFLALEWKSKDLATRHVKSIMEIQE